MKKSFIFLLSAVVLLSIMFSLTACGGDSTESGTETKAPVTKDAISTAVFGAVTFTDELAEIEADVASLLYPCEDAEEIYAYCGSGALAEELVIVKSDDKSLITAFEAYRDKQIGIFEKYNMNEVAKLNDSFIGQVGDYIVYCVSPDSGAVSTALSSLTN